MNLNSAFSPAWDRPTSAAFACYCLEASFVPLLGNTGPLAARLATLLLEQPRILLYIPSFIPTLENILEVFHSTISRGPSIGSLALRSSGLSLSGLGASVGGTSGAGAVGGLAQQQQRKVDQNREKGRDVLFGILRDASSFLSQSGLWTSIPRQREGDSSSSNASGVIKDLRQLMSQSNQAPSFPPWFESLLVVRSRIVNLFSDLQPSNLSFLADLMVSCLLQAAATGEVLMEEAVAR